jgi:hypothetical protein
VDESAACLRVCVTLPSGMAIQEKTFTGEIKKVTHMTCSQISFTGEIKKSDT